MHPCLQAGTRRHLSSWDCGKSKPSKEATVDVRALPRSPLGLRHGALAAHAQLNPPWLFAAPTMLSYLALALPPLPSPRSPSIS